MPTDEQKAGADRIMDLLARKAKASGVTLDEYIKWWLDSEVEEEEQGAD